MEQPTVTGIGQMSNDGIVLVKTARQRAYHTLTKQFPQAVAQIQDYTVKVVVPLSSSSNQYVFDLLEENLKFKAPIESGINKSDVFVPTHIALGIQKLNEAQGFGNSMIYFYPDDTVFAVAGSSNAEWEQLLSIYTGRLSAMSDNSETFRALRTEEFMTVPTTQGTQAGRFRLEDAYTELQKQPLLFGKHTQEWTLTLSNGLRDVIADTTAGKSNHVILFLRGLILRGLSESVTVAD